jgi:hypothetical protein
MNRRVRNRTPGGVGGGRRKAPSYPMRTAHPCEPLRLPTPPALSIAGGTPRYAVRDDQSTGRLAHPDRGTPLPRQHQLVNRVRYPSLRGRVEDMHRDGAVPDDPDVLDGPRRAIGVGCGARDRARREIELQMPRVAEGRLDRDAVDANQRRHHEPASFQHHSNGRRARL